MLISTKGRYALRVLLVLAEQEKESYVRLDEIASSQKISEKYLESIVSILVKAKLVEGHRGRGGGYRLTRAPEEYTVGEVLELTEGSLAPVSCLMGDTHSCGRAADCRTRPMWERLDTMISDYLHSVRLADLLKQPMCGAQEEEKANT